MPNEIKEPEQKIISRKHIARLEKEKRQRKVLLISIISILAIVVLLIVYGVLSKTVLLAGRKVATVNSDKITVEQFQKRVKYERFALEQQYLNYAMSPYAQFFQSQLVEVQNQLDDYLTFGQSKLEDMITETLIIQKAKELGLTVSDEEVNKEIEETFGFYASGTPTPSATFEYRATSTFSPTQLSIITLTPIATNTPVETLEPATATPDLTALPTITEATPTATEVLPTNTPTSEPTATEIPPTPTAYTYEGFSGLYSTAVANLESQTYFGDADFREYIRAQLYNVKLYEYVTKDISSDQDMVWARHILVTTEDEAKSIIEKLNAGEDYGTLAAANSLDTSNSMKGGDLGWIYKGQMVKEFEDAIWSLDIGEISQPVQTSFGYHIIQILGHEVRQLTAEELNSAKSAAYQAYIDEYKLTAKTEIKSIWASVVPSEPSIPADYRIDTSATQ